MNAESFEVKLNYLFLLALIELQANFVKVRRKICY